MDFFVYLPIAVNSVPILLLLGLGGLVGFLSGLFGVGGGWLLTPLLIMIGIPPTVATASDSAQIVGASSSGTYAHYRMGNVDFKMGLFLLVGGLIGGSFGVHLVKVLRALGNADLVINVTYVAMLGIIGVYMFMESLGNLKKTPRVEVPLASGQQKTPSLYARFMLRLPWRVNFEKSGVEISLLLPLILGGFVGLLAAIMGVGGGFVMVPIMVYLLRMPMHVVVGTSLFQIFFTCVNVAIQQAYVNHTVDFILALFLLIGSSIFAQVGARINKRLKGDQIKILLAVIILVVMVRMLSGLILPPSLLLSYSGGH